MQYEKWYSCIQEHAYGPGVTPILSDILCQEKYLVRNKIIF